MTTFGERLRDSMTAAGISIARLSKKLGVSRQTVAAWLKMADARLSGRHTAAIGLLLRVSIIWLALGVGTPQPMGSEQEWKARLSELEKQ